MLGLFVACNRTANKPLHSKNSAIIEISNKNSRLNHTNLDEQFKWTQLLGTWCLKDEWTTDGELFSFDFRGDSTAISEVCYYTGGPFEEILSVELVSEHKAVLYFDYAGGSISFNEIRDQNKLNENNGYKVAECTILNDGSMKVLTFNGPSGLIVEGQMLFLHKLKEDESCFNFTLESENENPQETIIAKYSPEQLTHLLGKEEPDNIQDLLLMLPRMLTFRFDYADKKAMIAGKKVGGGVEMSIGDLDLTHHYLNFRGAYEGHWEMCAKKINNGWGFAVNYNECGPSCFTEIAKMFYYEDGVITEMHYANLAGYQNLWPALFIDFDLLTAEQINYVESEWNNMDFNDIVEKVLFKLPRDGENIIMYIDQLFFDELLPYEAFKEVKTKMWE